MSLEFVLLFRVCIGKVLLCCGNWRGLCRFECGCNVWLNCFCCWFICYLVFRLDVFVVFLLRVLVLVTFGFGLMGVDKLVVTFGWLVVCGLMVFIGCHLSCFRWLIWYVLLLGWMLVVKLLFWFVLFWLFVFWGTLIFGFELGLVGLIVCCC